MPRSYLYPGEDRREEVTSSLAGTFVPKGAWAEALMSRS
jgi:hypothetical protein